VADTARTVAARFGFQEIVTPIFEFTDVFSRTLGETSDIVTKEMYTFTDRGGDSITLRPEGTAGVARAVVSGKLTQQLPLKFFYTGPMFRYERPQKGRLRQFHQVGVEALGLSHPLVDVETIAAGAQILDALGVAGKVTLEINTLGDAESRNAYREALVAYLSKYRELLSPDSKERFARNPLRILDSKNPTDHQIIADAPEFTQYLTPEARQYFDAVLEGLASLGLAFLVNTRLVRGLDYYCHTAFEFTTRDLGAQGAVLAGGRYDGLVESMGGPPTPGIGWAAGIERLAMLVGALPPATPPFVVVPVSDAMEAAALRLAHRLRTRGFSVEFAFRGNLKKRMKFADKVGARAALLLGEDELARESVTLRDLVTGEQREIGLAEIEETLKRFS
jgi:histidyl-tRNA synthetase